MSEPARSRIEDLMRRADEARRDGRSDDAQEALVAALTAAREAEDRRAAITALRALARIDRYVGRPDEARHRYEEAVELCRREGDARLTAHTVRHLGDLHRHDRRLEAAERCYDEAIALYREISHTGPLELANALRPMAILRQGAGRADEARRLWEEARELYATARVRAGVDECDVWLARLDDRRPGRDSVE